MNEKDTFWIRLDDVVDIDHDGTGARVMNWATIMREIFSRDEFAKAALTGLLAGRARIVSADSDLYEKAAKASYRFADAMMKAREVGS